MTKANAMLPEKILLTRNQNKAVAALLTYPTIQEAAEAVGVNRVTISKWLTQPAFLAAVQAAEAAAIREATRDLVRGMAENFGVLLAVRDDPENPPGVRLRAARALDNSLLRWRNLVTMEERLTRLEETVYKYLGK